MGKKHKRAASAKPARSAAGSIEAACKRTMPIVMVVVIILAVVAALWAVKGIAEPSSEDADTAGSTSANLASAADPESSTTGITYDIWALNAKFVDMDAIAGANIPAVIDFGSDSCVPCKQMAPVLKMSNEKMQGRAIIKFIDAWKYTDAANGFPVQVIPTQVFMMPGGAPYVPSEGLAEALGLEFSQYSDDSGELAFTTHQGALTQGQMDAILEDMGA